MIYALVILIDFLHLSSCLNTRLDINSHQCDIYIAKLMSSKYQEGLSQLSFTGFAQQSQEGDAVITFQYTDNQHYFHNTTYFGLTQEDGKKANETCLDLILFKFNSSKYTNPVEIKNITYTPSNDSQQYRYLSFNIKSQDFDAYFFKTKNTGFNLYTGYFAVQYVLAETNYSQFLFYFQIIVSTSRSTFQISHLYFMPWNEKETNNCNIESACIVNTSTILKYCTDFNCTEYYTPKFIFEDHIYMQQLITTEEFKNYKLVNTSAYLYGNGIFAKAIIKQVNNSKLGSVIFELSIDLLWNNTSIFVSSNLVDDQFQQPILVNGFTDPIECMGKYDSCPDCSVQLFYQGLQDQICECDPTKVSCISKLIQILTIAWIIGG